LPRTEEWIYIITPEHKTVIASPSYVAQLMGVCALKEQIQKLEFRISLLEQPMRRKMILDLLKKHGGSHTQRWFRSRMKPILPRYYDLLELENEGKLKISKSGHHTLYGLKETTPE